jgi:hypothetical protein
LLRQLDSYPTAFNSNGEKKESPHPKAGKTTTRITRLDEKSKELSKGSWN